MREQRIGYVLATSSRHASAQTHMGHTHTSHAGGGGASG